MNGQQAWTAIIAQRADALSIMGTSRVSKTVAEKLEVIAWNETHGDGIPARALKHFRDERGWIMSGSQIRQWWKKREQVRQTGTTLRRVAGGEQNPGFVGSRRIRAELPGCARRVHNRRNGLVSVPGS
ncbi:hypothetical protein JG687_00015433 [Phytophthora cactorum]|uniref:Uncharacterized protein n=3 Tax=Phytophthora cactorum TaxID=29920 RepID=A0A8T1TWZ4_9STRA|nr:hypothetical protein PC120_g20941 [Phytophthora cactorum]KAG6948516.1 hypothetical protein JG687_00015433 [Phytophthora cactorum]